ncbi:MAG: hypothetical protein RBS07_17070, partial [Lentimicrobium sp.]|nr:hypothetical protein [Lentimicrobium sp.]
QTFFNPATFWENIFKKLFPPRFYSSVSRDWDCKSTHFLITRNYFLNFFLSFYAAITSGIRYQWFRI